MCNVQLVVLNHLRLCSEENLLNSSQEAGLRTSKNVLFVPPSSGILKNTERYRRADHRITTFLTDRLKKDDKERQAKKARIDNEKGGTVRTHDVEKEHTSASSAGPTAD